MIGRNAEPSILIVWTQQRAHFGVKLGSRGSGLARASFGLKLKVWMSVNGFLYSSFVDMLGDDN